MENVRWKKELYSIHFKLLFIVLDRFREIIIYHGSSACSNMSRRGSPFAHWCSSQTPDHRKRWVGGRIAIGVCIFGAV